MAGNDKFVGVRLPTDLEALAKIAAIQDNRTLGGYIRDLIVRDIRSRMESGTSLIQETGAQYIPGTPIVVNYSEGKRRSKKKHK